MSESCNTYRYLAKSNVHVRKIYLCYSERGKGWILPRAPTDQDRTTKIIENLYETLFITIVIIIIIVGIIMAMGVFTKDLQLYPSSTPL